MRTWIKASHTLAAGAALSLGLGACSPSEKGQSGENASVVAASKQASDERAYFEQLLSTPFEGTASASSEQVDFETAFANLPDGIIIETGAVSTVNATGTTRVEDFAIVYDLGGTGVGI